MRGHNAMPVKLTEAKDRVTHSCIENLENRKGKSICKYGSFRLKFSFSKRYIEAQAF